MNATKTAVNRAFAIFTVMALVLCSFAAVFATEGSEAASYSSLQASGEGTPNQVYTLDISTGQQFVYDNITTSLDNAEGTLNIVWSGDAADETGQDGIAWDSEERQLSGTFTSGAGTTRAGILTATWTLDPSDNGNTITQIATQKINFNITQGLSVTPTITAHALNGWTADTQVLTINYTGTGDIDLLVNGADGTTGVSGTPFKVTMASNIITVSTNEALDDADVTAGSYTLTMTLTNSATQDTAQVIATIYVYDEIAIQNTQTHFYTFEGDSASWLARGINVQVSYDNDSNDNTTAQDSVITFTPSTDTILSQDSDNADHIIITGVTGATMGSLVDEDQTSKTYQATVSVTGTITDNEGNEGDGTSTASMDFYVHVYKSFQFTTTPSIASIDATPVGTNSSTILLSTYISGADSVVIEWGDGYRTTPMSNSEVSANFTSTHTYSAPGTYLATVYATNDQGTTTSKVMYSVGEDQAGAGTDEPEQPADGDGEQSFFDEHGWLFIVFAALAVFCVIGFFFIMPQNPVWIVGLIVCAILAVLLFVYVDFAGIGDAIGDLFGNGE